MKRLLPVSLCSIAAAALMTVFSACGGPSPDIMVLDLTSSPGQDYIALFNGVDFSGWDIEPDKGAWIIEDGLIKCIGKPRTPYLIRTTQEYENFDFYAEFNASEGCNSGIFFHVPMKGAGRESRVGFETQIDYGQPPGTKTSTGSIYDVIQPLANTVKPAGEWNQYRVQFDWPVCKVWLNGILVQEADFREYPKLEYRLRSGAIGLSNHGHPISYRNIWIKKLPGKEEWTQLVSGGDLSGWTQIGGADWKAEDDMIIASGGDGYLVTNDVYENYHFMAYADNDTLRASKGCFYYRFTSPDDPGYRADFFNFEVGKQSIADFTGKLPPTVSHPWKYPWLPYQIISTGRQAQIRTAGDITGTRQILSKAGTGKIAIYHHPDDGVIRIKAPRISKLEGSGI